MPYPDYDPNESFQLQSPFANAPDPGAGASPAAFPSYAPPAPTWTPDPSQQAQQGAFDRVFGPSRDISGADQPSAWADPGMAQPAAPMGAPPDAGPIDQAAPPAPGYSTPGIMGGEGLGRMDAGQRRDAGLAVNRSEGDYDTRKALTEAGLAENKVQLLRSDRDAQDEKRKFYDPQIEQALAISKARTQELQQFKPTDLWQNSDGGKREGLIMMMVLGGATDAMTGRAGLPTAMAALDSAMTQNKERNAARLDALVSREKAAGRDVADLMKQREEALVDIEHRSAAQWKVLSAQADADISAMAPGQQRDKAVQNAVKINEAADQQEERAQQAAANLAATRVRAQLEQRKLHARAGGRTPDPNDPYAGMNANQRDIAKRKDEALAVSDIDGNLVGRALSPVEGKNLREGQAAARDLRDKISDLKDMVRTDDTWDIPGSDSAQRREAIMVPAAASLSVLGKTGILNKEEYARYKGLLSAHAWTSREAAINGLDQLDRETASNYARAVQSHSKPFSAGPSDSVTSDYNKDSGGVNPAPLSASRRAPAPLTQSSGGSSDPGLANLPPGAQPVRQKSTGRSGYILNGVFTPTQ